MGRYIFFAVTFFFSYHAFGQQKDSVPPEKGIDSLTTDLNKRGIIFQEATFTKEEINPLAPSRAAFYSAILPGLGQIYNKKYWKAPIVWGALGLSIYGYSFNATQYRIVSRAFKSRLAGFTTDEFYFINDDDIGPDFSDEALQDAQERYQRDRDLMLIITIGLYALNIIDANVDAHLKQYNVSEQLSMDVKPFMEWNQVVGAPNYGLAMQLKF